MSINFHFTEFYHFIFLCCVFFQPLNYEEVKNLELVIEVQNKAPFRGSGANGGANVGSGGRAGSVSHVSRSSATANNTYSVKIRVMNGPEGASFEPTVKVIPISEGGQSINIKEPVASYPTIDGDTGKPAEDIRSVHTHS